MVTLQDFKEDLPLLVESGLVAIKQGDEESARKLFNAIGILDPQNTAPKMGFGLIALHKMDIPSAQKHFQELLEIEKTNWRAQGFLALAHLLSVLRDGTDDQKRESLELAAGLAQGVLDNSQEPSTRQLAQSLLDWEKELMNKVDKS